MVAEWGLAMAKYEFSILLDNQMSQKVQKYNTDGTYWHRKKTKRKQGANAFGLVLWAYGFVTINLEKSM